MGTFFQLVHHLILQSCSYSSGQGVSWPLNRKRGGYDLVPSFSILNSSGFLLLGICKIHFYRWRVHNMNELRDRTVRAAERISNEMFPSTWWETEYRLDVCRASNGAHTEIYRAHEKLCEIQCLKMYRFIQYTLWLDIYNVLFLFLIMPGSLYLKLFLIKLKCCIGSCQERVILCRSHVWYIWNDIAVSVSYHP
jgi:hypothetical protein